jgi:hypothetical protein
MSQSTESRNKAIVLEAFERFSTNVTTARRRASGHPTTCNTAPTLSPAATVSSI